MTPTIANAFLHPLTSFAGPACQGLVVAVCTTSIGVCVCCIPYADPGPLTHWATRTAPAAQHAVTQSAHDGTTETQREVQQRVTRRAVHPSTPLPTVSMLTGRVALPTAPRVHRLAPPRLPSAVADRLEAPVSGALAR